MDVSLEKSGAQALPGLLLKFRQALHAQLVLDHEALAVHCSRFPESLCWAGVRHGKRNSSPTDSTTFNRTRHADCGPPMIDI